MSQPKQAIVVTGALGFVGTHVLDAIKESGLDSMYHIIGIIRPETSVSRTRKYASFVTFIEFDLKTNGLDILLANYPVACIIHLAAVIHTKGMTKQDVFSINSTRTKEIGEYALQNDCQLIYCSSVGVYGSLPSTVPAQIDTPLVKDTWYHESKIESEISIQEQQKKGLRAVILRPSILYGMRDTGFLLKIACYLKKGWFVLPKRNNFIHLTSARFFGRVCVQLINENKQFPDPIVVVDRKPVLLSDICVLMQTSLPRLVTLIRVPFSLFRIAERVCTLLRCSTVSGKLKRISRDWYFSTDSLGQILSSEEIPETIDELKQSLSWYLKESESKTI